MDTWEEAVEKAIDAKAKTLLQLLIKTRKINSRCSRGNKPAKRRKKTPERLSLLTFLLLAYLVENTSNFPPTRARLARETKITKKEVPSAKKVKGVVVLTPLQ